MIERMLNGVYKKRREGSKKAGEAKGGKTSPCPENKT
jgi:hypothetical protein